MSALSDAAAAIAAAAAQGDPALRVHQLGEDITPPAVIAGPASFTLAGQCPGAMTATFPVWVVVALNDRSVERLYELAPAAAEAIEASTEAVVTAVAPGTYTSPSGDLPAYELTAECPIT